MQRCCLLKKKTTMMMRWKESGPWEMTMRQKTKKKKKMYKMQ